jgi:hypothetical protein
MPCFSISEPHTGTSPLAIQDKLRQQTIVCLKAAIAAGGLTAEEKHRSQTILIEHLHHVDERTRELSIPALITLLEYYHVSELALNADVEKECLCALSMMRKKLYECAFIIIYHHYYRNYQTKEYIRRLTHS